ncbi:hypothetical protein SAMN02982985_03543 [Rugamonas rubra]|uniref:Uncharacterized protein n=1 Tax=Rugamonas rubra TaxID=758825 RepID=A0A1I4PQZ6_9BURK|nr:hypothetical protein SAMN02982985_03543 [Rugamonas rubra]
MQVIGKMSLTNKKWERNRTRFPIIINMGMELTFSPIRQPIPLTVSTQMNMLL